MGIFKSLKVGPVAGTKMGNRVLAILIVLGSLALIAPR